MGQREQLRAKLEAITIDNKKCIDWGSGAKPAAKYVKHTKCKWLCVDKNKDLVGQYKDLKLKLVIKDIAGYQPKPDNDVAFCLEVLEHTLYPRIIVSNIYGSLKEGGKLYLSVPFMYPEHSEEDYWRFTKYGLRHLLKEFSEFKIEPFENSTGYWVEATR